MHASREKQSLPVFPWVQVDTDTYHLTLSIGYELQAAQWISWPFFFAYDENEALMS